MRNAKNSKAAATCSRPLSALFCFSKCATFKVGWSGVAAERAIGELVVASIAFFLVFSTSCAGTAGLSIFSSLSAPQASRFPSSLSSKIKDLLSHTAGIAFSSSSLLSQSYSSSFATTEMKEESETGISRTSYYESCKQDPQSFDLPDEGQGLHDTKPAALLGRPNLKLLLDFSDSTSGTGVDSSTHSHDAGCLNVHESKLCA